MNRPYQGEAYLSTAAISPGPIESQWSLPYKGQVGMFC